MTQPSFNDIAVALALEAANEAERLQMARATAARIGLSAHVEAHYTSQLRAQCACLARAHSIFKALAPIEPTVLHLIGET